MTSRLFLATALTAALVAAAPASASTIINTGTPTSSTRYLLSPAQSLAGRFTLTSATTVQAVRGYIFGPAATGTLSIYSDANVPTLANLLFSSNFAIVQGESWQGLSGLSLNLAAGNYWASFAANVNSSMRSGAPSPLAAYAYTNAGNWYRYDPANVGVQVDGVAGLGGVPEPMTWALMILGFGVIGGAMRRRSAAVTTRLTYA